MSTTRTTATYVGQVERDPAGALWAVLYYRDEVLTREPARSLRKAKRRVCDLVLSAADNNSAGPMIAAGHRKPVDVRVPRQSPALSIAHFA